MATADKAHTESEFADRGFARGAWVVVLAMGEGSPGWADRRRRWSSRAPACLQ